MALIVVPCCIYDNCPDDNAKTTQTENHNTGDEDGCGTCSPFFSCEGCVSNSKVSDPITFTPDIIIPGRITYTNLVQSFLSYDFHSIWQPPQII